MMDTFSSFGGHAFLYGFHKLFILAFLLGLLFFIVWALRNLKKDRLKKWAVTLLVIGILGCLLTMFFGGFGYKGFKGKLGFDKMHSGMWQCMQDDECREKIESMMELKGLE